jgi:hypothetical protein
MPPTSSKALWNWAKRREGRGREEERPPPPVLRSCKSISCRNTRVSRRWKGREGGREGGEGEGGGVIVSFPRQPLSPAPSLPPSLPPFLPPSLAPYL